jgi:hypothetical protein
VQPVRTAVLGRRNEEKINSYSIRFDEGASAETKLALVLPSEEEKGGKAPNGWPESGVVTHKYK